MLDFTKMNGAGNDFVMVDNRDRSLQLTPARIAWLCDRHRGVGADGVLAVEPSRNGGDFRMRYYNSDGGEAEMCGNGARCFARFVATLQGGSLDKVSFETIAGMIHATLEESGDVCIDLGEPCDLALHTELEIGGRPLHVHSVNTGVPHAVVVVDEVAEVDVAGAGAAIRRHPYFAPKGTNVNFMQVLAPGSLTIRTYERGVEAETLACGTGMVACAIIHHSLDAPPSPIRVKVLGGDVLRVGFDVSTDAGSAPARYSKVTLTGPADLVFHGAIRLPDHV